ncbi:MAG: hypothetical protein SOR57_10345, partial [Parabacteroides sp.]|nr:hypothetical protein [Parabacteroides sp.]
YQVLTVFILKILVLLVDICNIFKELISLSLFLIAVAKVRTFILNFQIFSEVFLFFLQLSEFRLDLPTSPISERTSFLYLSIMLTTASLSIAGAKVERFFELTKYFARFF